MHIFKRRKIPSGKQKAWDKEIEHNVKKIQGTDHIRGRYTVDLNTVNKVNRFANLAQISHADVMIYDAGGNKVPGDSIMGLFSISLLQPVHMVVEGEQRYVLRFIDSIKEEGISVTESYREAADE